MQLRAAGQGGAPVRAAGACCVCPLYLRGRLVYAL